MSILSTETQTLISDLCSVGNFPVYIFQDSQLIFSSQIPHELCYVLEENYFQSLQKYRKFRAVLVSGDQTIYFAIDYIENGMVLIGPMSISRLDFKTIHQFTRKYHIQDNGQMQIPVITYAKAARALALIHYFLTGEQVNYDHLCDTLFTVDSEFPSDILSFVSQNKDAALQKYQLSNSENEVQHLPYQVEEQLLSAVASGDLDTINRLFLNTPSDSAGTMSTSTYKNSEYGAVIGISLFARAAIKGGVDPYTAYGLSDIYLQKLSLCHTISEHSKLIMEAAQSFVSTVKKVKGLEKKSIHTQKAKSYIARHLNKPFTIQDLADYAGIDKAYLMRTFRKYENQTIMDYVYTERINAAKNMLKYSDYSINQIASYLCFGTHSYFGTIFRKYTGQTPSEYRMQNQVPDNHFDYGR